MKVKAVKSESETVEQKCKQDSEGEIESEREQVKAEAEEVKVFFVCCLFHLFSTESAGLTMTMMINVHTHRPCHMDFQRRLHKPLF